MKYILTSLIFFYSLFGWSQEYYDDAQLRLGLYLEKKLGDKFDIHFKGKGRITYDVTDFSRASGDIGVGFKLNKNIKLLLDYVYIEKKNKDGVFSGRHWYYGALILKKDVRRWRFLYRNMLQVRNGNYGYDEFGYIIKFYDRNKFMIKYEATKRFSFYVSEELYIPLNNPQAKGADRSRATVGTFIRTLEDQGFEIYFTYQQQLQSRDWFKQRNSYPNKPFRRDFIYGLTYKIVF
jgi:hypothetical protein